jgi:hypothetical protein
MTAFIISKPIPAAGTITAPGQITLNFFVSGNDPCQIKLTYHLSGSTNIFFRLADGTDTKEIIQNFTLQNPPRSFSDDLKIVKSGPNPDYSLGYIYIDGIDTNNNDTDHQLFTVHFL